MVDVEDNTNRKKKVVKLFEKKRRWAKDKEVVETLKAEIDKIPDRSVVDTTQIKRFLDLPISQKTLIGLKYAGYEQPTEIQKESLGLSLKGRDILGAAKTGSGKTLAFLIPVIELLYRNEWTHLDRLGAVIITPVRELAYQIFEILKKIGKKHDFSAGLIIGGKDLEFERSRLRNCNIIICTPGRLLHHMNKNPHFDSTNVKILVLDEADKIMELGFAETMNAIIENLPQEKQTLLFSATQTKSVKDLARLSLKDPVYVSVHENSKNSTPDGLTQSYVVCELHDKFNLLWSFIKGHLKKKILVFMASCKQVKYSFEAICKLRPGMSILALHGGMHQLKRMDVYNQFCNKRNAVLIATDIAARGLDFPAVNWVIQMDCPEDATTYIHRAGRTARYEKDGESLLVLLPSEEKMATYVLEKRIPITKIKVNPKKQLNVHKKLEALLAMNVELKQSAQRAFVAYLKSVFLMKDKSVFDVTKLSTEAYARSLGLATAPRIRFLQKKQKLLEKTLSTSEKMEVMDTVVYSDDSVELDESKVADNKSNDQSRNNSAKEAYNFGYDSDSNEDDSLFTLKRRIPVAQTVTMEKTLETISNKKKKLLEKPLTKAVAAKKILKKNIKAGQKIVFDDEGKMVEDMPKRQVSQLAQSQELMGESGIDIETAKQIMREEDKIDKEIYRQRIKAARKAKKLLAKKKTRQQEQEEEGEEESIVEETKQDDWSSGDEDSVDLGFLPDPDKVYNEGNDIKRKSIENDDVDDDEQNSDDDEEQSSEEDSVNSGDDDESSSDYEREESSNKRKNNDMSSHSPNKKRLISKDKISSICSDLTLKDTESLALQLLESKRF